MTLQRHQFFTQTLQAIFTAQADVPDIFFNRRLINGVANVIDAHIQYHTAILEQPERFEKGQRYSRALKDIDQILEEIIHVSEGPSISLAIAREKILYYLRETIQEVGELKIRSGVTHLSEKENDPEKPVTSQRPLSSKAHITRAKILEFIRQAAERRSKEIIDEFNTLSERTIMRGLKELSREGLIVKKLENRAVYYSAVY